LHLPQRLAVFIPATYYRFSRPLAEERTAFPQATRSVARRIETPEENRFIIISLSITNPDAWWISIKLQRTDVRSQQFADA